MECVSTWIMTLIQYLAGFGDWAVRFAEQVAWPFMIGLALFWLRKPIGDRIRTGKVTARHGDTEITLDQPNPLETLRSTNTPLAATGIPGEQGTDAATVNFPSETVNPLLFPATVIQGEKTALAAALVTVPQDDRDGWLKMRLMEARILIFYATINNSIFQSQIDGLRELNARGPVSLEDAKTFFSDVQKKFPDVHRSGFDGWVSYLTRSNLVAMDTASVVITDFGKGFLEYLRIAHPTQIKLF